MNKEVKKIFLVLAFYALSGGIFYNFQELWMADNNLSTQTIGIVYSLCALLSVSTIFLCSNLITKKILKKFSCVLLLFKVIILFLLFILNHTGLNVIIKFLIMLDFVIDAEIYACIYPLITFITKNDKVYALRGLIYSYAYYGGILLTSFLLGKTIFSFNINFNTYCLVSCILMLISYIILNTVNLNKYNKNIELNNDHNALYKVIKIVREDKISRKFLAFRLTSTISYHCVYGLLITLLTSNLGFSASSASTFKLILGIIAVLIGTLILEKLTSKNDYINFSIKYVGRFIVYIIAVIFDHKLLYVLGIVYMLLFSESYSHITDAPYVNRFSTENQLAFCNLQEMVSYLAESIGNLICGFTITIGTRYSFIFAIIFALFQIIYGCQAIKLRSKEKEVVNL